MFRSLDHRLVYNVKTLDTRQMREVYVKSHTNFTLLPGIDSVDGIATRYELDGPGIESADPSGRAV